MTPLDRARGCLFGQLCGDSLGALVEFRRADDIRRQYPGGVRDLADGGTWGLLAGQPTDDSELALALARRLVADRRHDPDAVLAAYRRWLQSGPFDVGATTSSGLAGHHNHDSQANGSLMRVSPLGVFFAGRPAGAAAAARADSLLTHPHPVCQDACAAYTAAVAAAVGGTGDAYPTALATAAEPAVRDALAAAADGPPDDYSWQMGWVLIALRNAFWQLRHASSLEEGVVDTVMRGGDTDTNAAIAGALLGAVHGEAAIPARWRDAVTACRPGPGTATRHPRPEEYWPCDAEELAAALLAAGGP